MAKEEISIRIRQVVKAVREQVLEMNWSGRVVDLVLFLAVEVNEEGYYEILAMESAVGEKK